ncbi:hypothetical protein C464_00409 [Halorubrum coriense DSM 10284]|uniref:Uncharacterized protein n=1 Tax=Halorubrum coriense DSM 10284 TaxID=1227466 RepID=M0EVI2_9EURY|nr:hypothetical protein C464_00409 [Halorubrum coriense DSM 10284]
MTVSDGLSRRQFAAPRPCGTVSGGRVDATREAHASHHHSSPTMTADRSPSRRTDYPDPNAGPHPSEPLPSPGAMIAFAALPVTTVAVLSFPTAAAVALAALAGAVVGATLHRRYPSAVGRTLRLPDGDASVREP